MTTFTRIVLFCVLSIWSLAAPISHPSSPDTFQGRTFSASSSAPFAAQFNNDPAGKAALASVLNLLTTERNKHESRLANWEYGISTDAYPCNHEPTQKFAMGLNNSLASRGFGDLFKPCISDMKIELNSSMERSLFEYFRAVDRVKTAVLLSLQEIMSRAGRVWKEAYTYSVFDHLDEIQKCTLYHLTAFYVGGRWAVSADITNAKPSMFLEDYERWYLAESIYLDKNDWVHSLNMTATGFPVDEKVRNTTTTFSNWAGNPSTSRFTDLMTPAKNPAIQEAISNRFHQREQAEDSSTKSNIAIMLLPLATALIPIASIADVGKVMAFGYLLLTDVAAMMPLAIKGMELILFSQQPQDATILRIYGATSTATIGAAELWHAKCETQNHLRFKGTVFLSIAVCFMVIGIVLEVVLRERLWRRKRAYVKEIEKEEDVLDRQLWEKYGMKFVNCDCCDGELWK